jgi:hypothetical protein
MMRRFDMDKVIGLFGQELKVGDKIAMVAKYCGNPYMKVGTIEVIDVKLVLRYDWNQRKRVPTEVQVVKVRSHKKLSDPTSKTYLKEVHNWETAITL